MAALLAILVVLVQRAQSAAWPRLATAGEVAKRSAHRDLASAVAAEVPLGASGDQRSETEPSETERAGAATEEVGRGREPKSAPDAADPANEADGVEDERMV